MAVARAMGVAGRPFGFGGGAGAELLVEYFRGAETVVHATGWSDAVARDVGAVPDRGGPLVVFATMGTSDLAGPVDRTAHPLLVYAELARSDDPRAREAARLLFDRFLWESVA